MKKEKEEAMKNIQKLIIKWYKYKTRRKFFEYNNLDKILSESDSCQEIDSIEEEGKIQIWIKKIWVSWNLIIIYILKSI